MKFSVTILGNGSAVPTGTQNLTAQLVIYNGKRFLIDCGEGTQIQMIRYGTGFRNLNRIFISHLHGDHFFGLPGLLSTFHLYRRPEPLHIYGPGGLEEFLHVSLKTANTTLCYPLEIHQTEEQGILYEDNELTVSTFPLKHGIFATGFLFSEKERPRNIAPYFIEKYHPTIEQIKAVKKGAGFTTPDGKYLENKEITTAPKPPRKYAFCSDTAYSEEIIPHIKGADLLYHETTFDERTREKAAERFHSTAKQAATIAKKAEVKKLLTGHYSTRMNGNYSNVLNEAREIFKESYLSEQGKTYEV